MERTIAIYLQHYLSPSMTFIYRQITSLSKKFNLIVLNSKILENTELFPFDNIFTKKKSGPLLVQKINDYYFRQYPKDAVNPHLSFLQRQYFRNKFESNCVRLIHAHFGPSGLEVLPLAKKLNIPLFVTFHGFDASSLLKNEQYFNNIKELISYAHIIFISNKMADNFVSLGLSPKNYSIIRCGIPTDYFRFTKRTSVHKKYLRREKISFLQVANFVEKKGHSYTLEAFKKLINFYDNVELILAGDGPTRSSMENLSKQLLIQDKVLFKGKVNQQEAFELMKSADIFVHHSVTSKNGETEGIPTVIMEAMSAGLPVISTYHAGIPELVESGRTGFMVKEKEISSYTNKMIQLLQEENDFSLTSREKIIHEYNIDLEMEKLADLFLRSILDHRSD